MRTGTDTAAAPASSVVSHNPKKASSAMCHILEHQLLTYSSKRWAGSCDRSCAENCGRVMMRASGNERQLRGEPLGPRLCLGPLLPWRLCLYNWQSLKVCHATQEAEPATSYVLWNQVRRGRVCVYSRRPGLAARDQGYPKAFVARPIIRSVPAPTFARRRLGW